MDSMRNIFFNKLSLKIAVLFLWLVGGQESAAQHSTVFRVSFYNIENFFYPGTDSINMDQEFTPSGIKHWTWSRYHMKLDHLYKTLIAVGAWDPPGLIGLCEVENRKALDDLIYHTPLSKLAYKVIHFDSPDKRGIDCALLYSGQRFRPLSSISFPVKSAKNPDFSTRDILYVKGILAESGDTLHVFINHWPSRRNGKRESESKRDLAARTLRFRLDSILKEDLSSNLLIMGDFNDESTDHSLADILKLNVPEVPYKEGHLYSLSIPTRNGPGSLKYQGIWYLFDQIIVSGSLLKMGARVSVSPSSFTICNDDFLMKADDKFLGKKPFASYEGFKYVGGFSDHLPVTVDLVISKKANISF